MEIISLDNPKAQDKRLSNELDIALTRNTRDFDQLMHENIVLEGCCIILIEEGKANFKISGEECATEAGELVFINNGQSITDVMISTSLEFRAFLLSVDYSNSIASMINMSWKLRSEMMLSKYCIIKVGESEMRNIGLYYDLLDSKRQQTPHQQQEIKALCSAFSYFMLDLIAKHEMFVSQDIEKTTVEYDVTEQHFSKFMQLIYDNPTIEHKVKVYADKLCITPKYLNIICKKAVNQKPSDIIEKEITQRAIKMLKENDLNIKQIAQQLGFSNQSHFGTFMRRVTGQSPLDIREK